jgi:uncharacterized protein with beta-barrel porin domain
MAAAFQALPGARFVVESTAAPRDVVLLSLGADLRLPAGWTLRARLDGELGTGGRSYAGTGTIRYVW